MPQLNAEQEAALQALTDRHNASAGTSLSPNEYLDLVILGVINAEVDAAFARAVTRLSAAAATLSYEQRLALIAQVESSMPSQS